MVNSVGARLRQLRKRFRLNQKEMAQRLGVHPQTVSKYERQITVPRASVLLACADVFNVSLGWLLGKKEEFVAGEKLGLKVAEDKTLYVDSKQQLVLELLSENQDLVDPILKILTAARDIKEAIEKIKKI